MSVHVYIYVCNFAVCTERNQGKNCFNAKKLGSKFPVKDKTKSEHIHNVVYHAKCPNKKCTSHYTGQTQCRLGKRAIQHNKTDEQSHLLKHAKQTRHRRVAYGSKTSKFSAMGTKATLNDASANHYL